MIFKRNEGKKKLEFTGCFPIINQSFLISTSFYILILQSAISPQQVITVGSLERFKFSSTEKSFNAEISYGSAIVSFDGPISSNGKKFIFTIAKSNATGIAIGIFAFLTLKGNPRLTT